MARSGLARRTILLAAAAVAVVAATAVLLAVAHSPASLPRHGHRAEGAGRQPFALGPEKPIHVGYDPGAIAISPDGRTGYVANGLGTMTPINLATGTPGSAINVGPPGAFAITPDGRTPTWPTQATGVLGLTLSTYVKARTQRKAMKSRST